MSGAPRSGGSDSKVNTPSFPQSPSGGFGTPLLWTYVHLTTTMVCSNCRSGAHLKFRWGSLLPLLTFPITPIILRQGAPAESGERSWWHPGRGFPCDACGARAVAAGCGAAATDCKRATLNFCTGSQKPKSLFGLWDMIKNVFREVFVGASAAPPKSPCRAPVFQNWAPRVSLSYAHSN